MVMAMAAVVAVVAGGWSLKYPSQARRLRSTVEKQNMMSSRRHQHSRQKLLTCFFHVVRVLNFASYRLCEYDAQEERRTRHKTYTFSSDCCCVKAVATLVDILGWLPPLGCAFLPLEGETREWLVRWGYFIFMAVRSKCQTIACALLVSGTCMAEKKTQQLLEGVAGSG